VIDLVDAEERARRHPTTFEMPPLVERQSLKPGDYAKLIFAAEPTRSGRPDGERMWVKVTTRIGAGYRGVLENTPVLEVGCMHGDAVYFFDRHIIAIECP